MDQKKIGQFIRTLRREKNMTQDQLAEEMNVSRRTVSRWETGYNMPDLAVLIDLADYFGVDLREILDGEKKEKTMKEEDKETLVLAARYADSEKKKELKTKQILFVSGYVSLLIGMLTGRFTPSSPSMASVLDWISGACYGFSIVIFICSIMNFAKGESK